MSVVELVTEYWSCYLFIGSASGLALSEYIQSWGEFILAVLIAAIWPVWLISRLTHTLVR